MLAITGATKLYYVSGFTDMRSGKYTLANVVCNSFHRNPYNGDGYVFRSKDGKKVKILVYKQSLYRLYDLSYDGDCRFMKIENEDGSPLEPCTQLEWKYLVALINCPVRRKIRI
jgi:transposase